MGNNNYGSIYVQTEKPFYFAGDMVNGYVYLNIMTFFPGSAVHLKIKGHESCYFKERKTRTREYYQNGQKKTDIEVYYIDHHGRNYFFCHRIQLYSWGSGIRVGQFQLPF